MDLVEQEFSEAVIEAEIEIEENENPNYPDLVPSGERSSFEDQQQLNKKISQETDISNDYDNDHDHDIDDHEDIDKKYDNLPVLDHWNMETANSKYAKNMESIMLLAILLTTALLLYMFPADTYA